MPSTYVAVAGMTCLASDDDSVAWCSGGAISLPGRTRQLTRFWRAGVGLGFRNLPAPFARPSATASAAVERLPRCPSRFSSRRTNSGAGSPGPSLGWLRIDRVEHDQWIPSARGPSASTGREGEGRQDERHPATIPTNCGRCVGSVPMDSGVWPCLPAIRPGPARGSSAGNRPITIAPARRMVLYQTVLTLKPAKCRPVIGS